MVTYPEYISTLISRVAPLVGWALFIAFHSVVVTVVLFVLWWYQIPPQSVHDFLSSIYHSHPFRLIIGLGFSAIAIPVMYMKIWRKLCAVISTSYIFRGIL